MIGVVSDGEATVNVNTNVVTKERCMLYVPMFRTALDTLDRPASRNTKITVFILNRLVFPLYCNVRNMRDLPNLHM